jgi:hypothetical protein
LPASTIQEAYLKIYGIKEYHPTILQPTLFTMDKKISYPVYYLLNFQMATEFSPKSNMKVSNIADLCMIRNLISIYQSEISSNELNVQGTPYYEASKQVEFKLFHSNSAKYHEIFSTKNIPVEDPKLLKPLNKNTHSKFPHDSSVIKGGCIRIGLTDKR